MALGRTRREAPTRTTVMVLNFNGKDHLEACLSSLGRLDVFAPGNPGAPRDPSSPDQVWIVDNASTDGSVEFVRSRFPWVRIVESDTNLGFSRAYNRAAAMASSESVVFLNDDTKVDPGFLTALHETRARHPEAQAVAARIMTWDGSRVDFAGADTFFTGHAWQRGLGEPAEGRSFEESRLLFGCAGALLVQRAGFLGIGGFDPDYFSFFEDVDLGWRAALAGHDTWFAPGAIVHHKHHGSWGQQPLIRVCHLTDRNALFSVFKNYQDERMGVMLLLAACLTFMRGWCSSDGIRIHGRPFLTSVTMAHLQALADLAVLLPALRHRREHVQRMRQRSDEEILPLFGAFASPPTALGPEYREVVRALTVAAGITDGTLGGPFPDSVNTASQDAALRLAEVCAKCVCERYPTGVFVAADWDPFWEHEVGRRDARALTDVSAAVTRFASAGITAGSLDDLRAELTRASRRDSEALASAPTVHRYGVPPGTGGTVDTPTVTVVVRTKDRLDSLGRALASVVGQTLQPFEIVVVNDGGADPANVLAGFEDRAPITLVSHPSSLGRSRAAQAGLEAARSTHVLFVDDDDELRPDHLRTLVSAIRSEGVRVAYTDVECQEEVPDGSGGTRFVPTDTLGGPFDASRLPFENTIPIMAVLAERALALEVGGFDPDLEYFEDWDLWIRLSQRTRFHHCPVATAVYNLAPSESGGGLAGDHRWPHLARLFDKHRDHVTGMDWARFYSRHSAAVRESLTDLKNQCARLEQERARLDQECARLKVLADEMAERLRIIEGSRGWRIYQWLRRLLGRR